MPSLQKPAAPADEAKSPTHTRSSTVGRYRWVICALLFFATTINYIDRQVLGIIAPGLQNGPTLFTPAMIAEPQVLARELRSPNTPAARLIGSRLSPSMLASPNSQALASDLNRIVAGPPLYDPAVFPSARLSEHLQQQLKKFQKSPPKGEDAARFNHWLIEESFPGAIAPSMRWSDVQYGYINSAFSAAYAIGMLLVGALLDRFGVRVGYALALLVWSLAAMSHALAGSAWSFGVARFALGWARRPTSQRPSRQWPSGSREASGRCALASLTQAPTSEPSWRRCAFRPSRWPSGGRRRLSSRA